MKKFMLVVLAVFLMSGIASAATTVDIHGLVRVYPEFNNTGRSSGLAPVYLMSPAMATAYANPPTAAYKGTLGKSTGNFFTDQRTHLYFNVKSDENVGANIAFEIDSFWGQSAFSVARDGTGGGQGSDSVNIEVKYANLWFKPTDALKVTAGIQTFRDDMAGVFIGGGDVAGFRFDYALSRASSLSTGLYTFWQNQLTSDNPAWNDSVYFVPLTLTQQLGGGAATMFVYTIQDNTKATAAASPATGGRPFGSGVTGLNYDSGEIYYAGLNYGGKAGNISYYLMGAYNFGTFKGVNSTAVVGPTTTFDDRKISAFALNAKVDVKMGDGNLRLQGLWVSGRDVAGDKTKFGGFVTGDQYSGHQTMPMLQNELILLVQNTDVMSNATVLVGNPNNFNNGLRVAFAAFDYNLSQKLNARAVVGYASADELQTGTTQLGKGIGAEYNAQLQYKFSNNLTIKGVASYAQLGDYFKAAGYDPDNAYRVLAKFQYSF